MSEGMRLGHGARESNVNEADSGTANAEWDEGRDRDRWPHA